MIARLAILLISLCLSFSAHAQTPPAPPPELDEQSLEGLIEKSVGDTYRILVIGDGLATGMGAGLSRMAESDSQFEIVSRVQETSGIARPEVYDWAESLPKIMEGREFDAVVVLIGSNDRQSIREGNVRHAFNTPEWVERYRANTAKILSTLSSQGVKIFWVALPPMGDALYEEDMKIVAALQKQEVAAKGGTYLDFRANFSNPDGTYTDRGQDETGEVKKLRARDGVGFLRTGNSRLGQLILAEIERSIEMPEPQPEIAAPLEELEAIPVTPPQDQAMPSTADSMPLFVQDKGDGIVVSFKPEELKPPKPKPLVAANVKNSGMTLTDIVPGSSAEKLFVQGNASPPPKGRFDDFTIAEPAR